ncbi:MAG: dihydroorotate dehydrogenase [Kiritimatiellae bacterium]|nr:dihydroorotate dehydrogenase [Kiritimatiellia bacterium]
MAMMAIDERTNLGGLEMATPLATASGTFGYGTEYLGAVDYSSLGAITVKGIRLCEWPGNNMPRHVEVPGGMVNAIGLQGPGIEKFLSHYLKQYSEKVSPKMIVNIWGGEIAEYAEVARRIDEAAKTTKEGAVIGAIECNVSCPNVKAGGHTFGQDPTILNKLVTEVRKATTLPLIVKLAPNFPDIRPYIKACEDGGADALSMINTIPAMVIDIENRRPVLANRTGGLSGRGIHPVAVKVVYDAYRATKLPILAMGGVYDARSAIELFLAGATAVALGSAIFTSPSVVGEVRQGILDYCRRHAFKAVKDLTGALEQ